MGIHINNLPDVFTVEYETGTEVYFTYHQTEGLVYEIKLDVVVTVEIDDWVEVERAILTNVFTLVSDEFELVLSTELGDHVWTEDNIPDIFTVRNVEQGEFFGEVYRYNVSDSVLVWIKENGEIGDDTLDNLPHVISMLNNKNFIMMEDDLIIIPEEEQVVLEEEQVAGIVSDGGKSAYYKIVLPQWVLDKQNENGYIMLEDLAEVMYGNDFNYTNIFKAQKRMFSLEEGVGKAGNDFNYDATKCKYYVDKQAERFNRK